MTDQIRKLIFLLDTRARRRFVMLSIAMLIASVFEAVGIGIILPFIQLLEDPSRYAHVEFLAPIYALRDAGGEQSFIIALGVVVLIFFIVKNAYLAGVIRFRNRFLYDSRAVLARRMFHRYLHAPYAFHLDRNSAELVKNITSSVGLVTNAMHHLSNLAIEVMTVVAIAMLLLGIEPMIVIIATGVLGVVGVGFTRYFRPRLLTWGRKCEAQMFELIKSVNQAIRSIKETRILGREDFFDRGFSTNAVDLARYQRYEQNVVELPRLCIETFMVGGLILVIGAFVISGRNTGELLPALAVFAAAAIRLMPSLNRIIGAYNSLKFSTPAMELVHGDLRILEDDPQSVMSTALEGEILFEDCIEFTSVTFSYRGDRGVALQEINLAIRKGETVGLVGKTGAGKTTLIDLLLGLHSPQIGRIRVDGVDIAGNLRSWQRHIGYVPQEVYLIDDTLRRNVAFGLTDAEIDDDSVQRAVRLAQLDGLILELPEGNETIVGEHGVKFSGGQRQRIGIARALYHDPDILVFDEATSALDEETAREITSSIVALGGLKTIIVIAHRHSTVRDCDRLVLLSAGRIVDSGTFDELIENNEEFQRMSNSVPADDKHTAIASDSR